MGLCCIRERSILGSLSGRQFISPASANSRASGARFEIREGWINRRSPQVKNHLILRHATIASCLAFIALASHGQTTSIKMFDPVNVRNSTTGTTAANPAIINSTTLNLNCAAGPIQAVVSSSSTGTANVLVDNLINLTVTAGESSAGPANICSGGTTEGPGDSQQNCFTPAYQVPASAGSLNGQNPDTLAGTGGVSPIDISAKLQPGLIQAKLDLVDTGGILASSSLYLKTNCTFLGVSGPAEITGNPIPASGATGDQLAQNFPFNSNTEFLVNFKYDLTESADLTVQDGTIPGTEDLPIDPATFQSTYVAGTSFATSNCLIHSGELLNNAPACKFYTLKCKIGTGTSESGANCPVSSKPDEIFQEVFDGPGFTLPDITNPGGPTFHQGVGFLMANEGWIGGACTFDLASNLGNLVCPQNLLTSFSGPGTYASTGRSTNPNSTFVTVAPVPEDLTTVSVAAARPGNWVNSHSAQLSLSSQPPVVPISIPGGGAFHASPINTVTYGISAADSVPTPGAPIATDTILTNPIPCFPSAPTATVFTPPDQTVTVPSDGRYLVHYFAQDCAGTQELKFTQDGSASWSTSFYTTPVNVDTVSPLVASGPTLSPAPMTIGSVSNAFLQGQSVTASYQCTDELSGVVKCGASTFAPGTTLDTGILTSPVDTSTVGSKTYTVLAIDSAGNQTTASVPYEVVAVPTKVDLGILKLGPSSVTRGNVVTYDIVVVNVSGGTASSVVMTDPIPAGLTFSSVSGTYVQCSKSGCTTRAASCSFASNTVTCTAPSLAPLTSGKLSGLGIQIKGRATAAVGATIKNTATVSSASTETKTGNNTSSVSTKVK
jgi:uncharacterized repeat protein (TIGR01451 family)